MATDTPTPPDAGLKPRDPGPDAAAEDVLAPEEVAAESTHEVAGPKPLSTWQRIRRHPVLGRLPLLLVVALGYWLYNDPSSPSERELVFQLSGPALAELRAFEIQIVDDRGVVLERAQRFFEAAPPTEVRLDSRLPEERFELRLFGTDVAGDPLQIQPRPLEISDRKTYVLHTTVRRPTDPSPPELPDPSG